MLSVHGNVGDIASSEVYPVLIILRVLLPPPLLLVLGVVVRLENLLLQSARTLLEYGKKLSSQCLNLIHVSIVVNIGVPGFVLR